MYADKKNLTHEKLEIAGRGGLIMRTWNVQVFDK